LRALWPLVPLRALRTCSSGSRYKIWVWAINVRIINRKKIRIRRARA